VTRRIRALAAVALAALAAPPDVLTQTVPKRLLYVTQSAGFAHDVLPLSESVLTSLGQSSGRFETTVLRDVSGLDAGVLSGFDAVAFFTTGTLPLDAVQKRALLDFVAGGKAFVGIHSATDTFYDWPEYGQMIGGYFDGHPWVETVDLIVEDAAHPAVAHLGGRWSLFEEIYQFRSWNRSDVRVLLRLDTATVDLGAPGVRRTDGDFALAWTRSWGKGRVFYTALGHHAALWQDPRFQQHLVGGIRWALDDEDRDGLADRWELTFGLSPNEAGGVDGGLGDPDGDGVSNRDELRDGSHPRGFFTRLLAEGATSDFFATEVALANPGERDARALIAFDRADRTRVSHPIVVPARRSRLVDVGSLPAMQQAEFATVIESDERIGVDRTLRWTRADGYGSHAEASLPGPSSRWFFAEGATHSGFSLFYLLQNPAPTPAGVEIRFLLPGGSTPTRAYTVPAGGRFTLWVNQVPGLQATDVSAELTVVSGPPIVAERAMYRSRPGRLFEAGHASAGIVAPAARWFLAEGATGPFFDLFVLVANVGSVAAPIAVTYLLPDGTSRTGRHIVAPSSRFNIWVNRERPDNTSALAEAAVSIVVESVDRVPIVVERAMWWPRPAEQWYEAHNAAGATTTGTRWLVAGGEVADSPRTDTYLLVANTAPRTASVEVTLLFDDGPERVRRFTVRPASRFNVDVRGQFPEAVGRRFGAIVESLGSEPAPLVVEESVYHDTGTVRWAAGASLIATRLDP
jgi:type 1 glutamine amidotransferase